MALDATVGGTSSDTYITLAEWQSYWAVRNVDLTAHGHDTSHEANLRQAADWLDRNYTYTGYRQYRDQRRAWPRITSAEVDGWSIDADTIPQNLKDAQAELAYLIHEGATPWKTIEAVLQKKRVKAGPTEVDYTYANGASVPRLVAIEGLMRPLTGDFGSGQSRLVRA